MANYEVDDIRNLVLIGHGSCGKTTLADAMMFEAKVTKRQGSVDDGSSSFDTEPDEIEKKCSIDSALAHFSWNGKEINLIDTPGYHDYISQVIGSLAAADIALIAISAATGIQQNTRKVWQLANDRGLSKAIVITKMDSDNIDLDTLLISISDTFGKECIPIDLPIGLGADFKGVVSVLRSKDGEGSNVVGDMAAVRENLVESAISVDDNLMEKYLDGAEIDEKTLDECFSLAIARGNVVPIFFCSAKNGTGVHELFDTIVAEFPSPVKMKKSGFKDIKSGEEKVIEAKKDDPFTAQVFKSVIDPFVGKLSFLRIFSGELKGELYNSRTKKREKVHHIYTITGKEHKAVETAIAGDIIAVTKIDNMEMSDTLCTEKNPGMFPAIDFTTPMVSLALEPKGKGAEHKIGEALSKLASEDGSFHAHHDIETNELLITGISNLHLTVMLDRLKRRFEIEVDTKPPKIPYKETITGKAEGKYKHKKQSGGHGQYGDVSLRVEPLERGEGFKFKNSIVGGSIPGQYIPAVEKGIRESLPKGILCGYHAVDFQAELFDGSFHSVDSSEAAFKIAGAKALHEAFNNASPVLLEPVVNIEVVIPPEFMGEISGNLSGRRGRIQGMDTIGDFQIVKAAIPMVEVKNYESELMSITGGQGSFTMEFSHYDVVPPHLATDIVSKEKKHEEES